MSDLKRVRHSRDLQSKYSENMSVHYRSALSVLADLYRDQRLPSCQIVAVSPCGRRWQQFAGVAPPGKDRRPPPRAGGPVTPLTSRRESRAADANLFASKSCSLSSAFAAKFGCPSGRERNILKLSQPKMLHLGNWMRKCFIWETRIYSTL